MSFFVGRSVLDGLHKIARHEGLLSLWRGTDAAILMTVPLVAIYLPLYDTLMDNLTPLGTFVPDQLDAAPFPSDSFLYIRHACQKAMMNIQQVPQDTAGHL